MTLWMPNKKKPLYAPMLATFGGGSVRGFQGAGGGGIDLSGEEFTFSGSQTAPESFDLGLGILADFDLQFDIWPDDTGNNPWILQTDGWDDDNGFLYGIYNPSSAIAGNGIGAYGYYSPNGTDISTGNWTTILVKVRFSGSVKSIQVYQNGSNNGTQTGYTSTGVNWNTIHIGMGRGSSGGTFGQSYDGKIRNITITQQ